MSRHCSSSAYGFRVKKEGPDDYVLSWMVDYHYPTSRLRFPRAFRHWTDEAGAKRFVKKHDLTFEFEASK